MSVKSQARSEPLWLTNIVFVVLVHAAALYALVCWPLQRRTLMLSVVLYEGAILSITMGYHRLWSHRSYRASWPVRLVLAFFGTIAFQGSIKWWVQRHRLHHRYAFKCSVGRLY